MDLAMPAKIQGTNPAYRLVFTIVNPEEWNKWGNLSEVFLEQYKKLFREVIFECHRYLIRCTPIDTGRLRGGWTGILGKYNQDYSSAFMDLSLVDVRHYAPDQSAITEGMALSQFQDGELDVMLINSVPYSEYVEFGTSRAEAQYFTRRAMYKSELIMKNSFENWLKDATGEMSIGPNTVAEVDA